MGHKLDLSGLTELEAEHVLQVVQRDMVLRKKEEQRLSDLRRELEEEDGRCLLLSRQTRFNRLCCMRCCSPFNFLLNPRRRCGDCLLNVCRACRAYRKPERAWLCSACQKRRLLKAQSLEWFYVNVKCRFKRFGSAKVLKTLYRKHLAEHGALADLTEGSTYEDSVYTEGSVCESDTALCRQSEEHGLADTLTVAKRVAGDAIDEAISKAEFHTDNQAKQNEAHYLRAHRGEFVEELAKTIVQKIIIRRKALAEMKPGFDQECSRDSSQGSLTRQARIWRSQSAFSLLDSNSSELDPPLGLRKGGGSAMSAWQSVDRLLDNSMLKSPDGNWITLQSGQLSRPGLLTRRKSLVFSALEQESGLVSAYRDTDSDPESPPEHSDSWGAVLQDLHKKMADGDLDVSDLEGEPQASPQTSGGSRHRRPPLAFMKRQLPLEIRRPSSSRRASVIDVNFNPEGTTGAESSGGEEIMERSRIRRSRRRRSKKEKGSLSSLPKGHKTHQGHASDGNHTQYSQSQHASDATAPDTLTSEPATPDAFDLEGGIHRREGSVAGEELVHRLQQLARQGSLSDASIAGGDDEAPDLGKEVEEQGKNGDRGEGQPEGHGRSSPYPIPVAPEGSEERTRSENTFQEDCLDRISQKMEDHPQEEEEAVKEMKMEYKSRVAYSSSAHPEPNGDCQSEGGWEKAGGEGEEEKEELVFQLLHLESQVRASQFSSTEDELDRVGRGDDADGQRREGGTRGEQLAAKLRRLAEQVSGRESSSTDEERESTGRGKAEAWWREGAGGSRGEAADEMPLRRMEAEKAVRPSQLRDLASLLSASQFSSTEDELDRVGGGDGGGGGAGREAEEPRVLRVERGEVSMEPTAERRGSMTGLFDFLDAPEADGGPEYSECCRLGDEETTPERTGHQGTTEEEREHGCSSLSGGCGIEDRDWPQEDHREVLSCSPVKQEQENREEQPLQTGKAKDTERRTHRDPTTTVNETRVSKDNILRYELGVDNSGEKQALPARTCRQAEIKSDMSEPKDMEVDRMRSEVENSHLDHPEGETDVLTKEAVGEHGEHASRERDPSERRGDRTTLRSICSGEGDTRHELRGGEDRTAGGSEEEGVIPSGGAGGFRLEELDDTPRGDINPGGQTSILSPEEIQHRYSAVSLRSLTTEMLKVLNATEALLHGAGGAEDPAPPGLLLSPDADPLKLDQQFSRLEENVYVAAGAVFGLESELGGLEECARGVTAETSDGELTLLEEQVASAAAKVHQSELQISNISARIAALKSAGLNVDSQSRATQAAKTITTTPGTSARQLRRRLPAPPVEGKEA